LLASSVASHISHAFFTQESIDFVSQVIRKSNIEKVVEVGCGSGYLGWQIQFLIKKISKESNRMCFPYPYVGYELQSYRGSVISDSLELSFKKNENPKDFSYLKRSVEHGATLFLSYVQPESSGCTMGVDALTTYCRFSKEYGRLPTLLLISDGDLTDGPQFRRILATYFKKIPGYFPMKGHIGADSPVIEFYEGRKSAF